MTPKTRRVKMRADPDGEARIAQAAAVHQSISAFVLSASVREADVVVARVGTTLMPAEQLDALMSSLEVPDEAPDCGRPRAGPVGSPARDRLPVGGPRRPVLISTRVVCFRRAGDCEPGGGTCGAGPFRHRRSRCHPPAGLQLAMSWSEPPTGITSHAARAESSTGDRGPSRCARAPTAGGMRRFERCHQSPGP
jgi:uncharacterized protein (DUF1778 family)